MTSKAVEEFASSLLFALASLLTGMMSALAFAFIWAKRGAQKHAASWNSKGAFLTDKERALSFYVVFSRAYDLLNPYLYTGKMRREIVSLIGGGSCLRVLDVGCGTGYTTEGILNRANVCEVVGVDMNPVQLGRAAKNLRLAKSKASLGRGDVDNLPFSDNIFDAVISVGAIEYFPDPERALKEMARVVKPKCVVVVGGPELAWFSKFGLDKVFYTPAASEVKRLFGMAGLGEVKAVLTGTNTFFGTQRYVVVASGTKPA